MKFELSARACCLALMAWLPAYAFSESMPWADIGAKATADYSGDGLSVSAKPSGAAIASVFQKLHGEATVEGLWIESTAEGGGRFRVKATALGRTEAGAFGGAFPDTGEVVVDGGIVRYVRHGVTEEYNSSVDGIRQDFLIGEKPAGEGELRLDLAIVGATAQPLAEGVRLTLAGSGRELSYHRLYVTDAEGKELAARMEVTANQKNCITLHVDDSNAVYPIRIDPTFSDANWSSMGGLPGANITVSAAVVDGVGNLYIGGDFAVVGEVITSRIARWDGTAWSSLGSGMNGTINALAVSGGQLYAGGSFTIAGGISANRIARWDGTAWSSPGTGMNNVVNALAVSGGQLYAGGAFTTAGGIIANRIARWDGTTWSPLGSGMNNAVISLAVSGGELYTGGVFTTAGGIDANCIARWDGTIWSPLGSGINSGVNALAVSGGQLYAGGVFTTAGGISANRIARWDGSAWSPLGSGMNSTVNALAVLAGELYAGGDFVIAGGISANRIARWDGTAWSPLGSGMNTTVRALAVSGGELYSGGVFTTAGGIVASRIARWNGSSWSALGSGMNGSVNAFAVSGSDLYAGGSFTVVGGISANRIAKWNGSTWTPLGSGMNGPVFSLGVMGNNIFAGGDFTVAGGLSASRIARWDGSAWSALGTGMNSRVAALAATGSDLYAGGLFTSAGGVFVNAIARWNGSTWSPLGTGLNNTVSALAISNNVLYVGGNFSTAGGTATTQIARWDGTSWSSLGTGLNGAVASLAVSGNNIYAGGNFTTAGGITVNRIARWDGANWSALGLGIQAGSTVSSLAVLGDEVFAGGDFNTAGGNAVKYIAHWDGTSWSPLGSGLNATFSIIPSVSALVISGSNLYVGGDFLTAGDKVSASIARAKVREDPLLSSRSEILLVTSRSQLLAFDANDGTPLGNFISGYTPRFAYDVEIGPDGHIYLLDFGGGPQSLPTSIHRFDGKTGVYLGQVMQTSGFLTETLAFHPDGSILLPNPSVGIQRYDSQTGQLLGTLIPYTPDYSTAAGLMADASGVFVSFLGGSQAGSVYRFDPATGGNPTVLATGLPGNGPRSAFRVPSGEIFVPVWQSNFIATFAANTLIRGADRNSHVSALGLALSPDNQLLSLAIGGPVQKIDLATGALIGTLIPAGSGGLDSSTAFTRHSIPQDPFFYSIVNGEVTIRQCDPSATGNLVIPSTIDGFPVTQIGASAFLDKSNITTITFPSSVTTIGSDAFKNCTALVAAYFLGNAPTMGTTVFGNTAPGFTVYFLSGKPGFTTPTWQGYPTVAMQAPVITSHPASQTITSGATASMTVSASGIPAPTYQWYQGDSGNTSNPIADAVGSSFTTPALTSTTSYWVRASNPSGSTANSNTATITVSVPPPQFPDLQVDVSAPTTATSGQSFAYTITARNQGNLAASIISVNFTVPSGLTVQNVTSAGGFTRQGTGTSPITFIGGSLAIGAIANLTVTVSTANASTYSIGSSAAVIDPSNTITESNESNNGSTQIINTVVSPPPEFTHTSAGGQSTITGYNGSGGNVTIPSTIGGFPVTQIAASAFQNKPTITSVTIPSSVTTIGNSAFNNGIALVSAYFLGNSPAMGSSVFNGAAPGFTVYFLNGKTGFTTPTWLGYPAVMLQDTSLAAPTILTHPASQTISSGATATLSVSATGNPLPTYQWFLGSSGNTASPISGATNASFTTPALTSAANYWVRVSNSQSSVNSNTATILIAAPSADLANLTVNSGSLAPNFNKQNLAYTVNVANPITSIRVTPTVAGNGATVRVNGATIASGAQSNPINLNIGDNNISVAVTTADLSTTKTYTVNVIRAATASITTVAAINITDTSAVLRGTVDPNGSTEVFFQYGLTTSYGNTTPSQFLSGDDPVNFQATISGLTGQTMIHYRAVTVSGGVQIFGSNLFFTTLSPPVVVVTGNPVVTATSEATLVGAVNTRSLAMHVYFEYGTTRAFGNTTAPKAIPSGSGIQDVFENITELIPGATYFVRLVATTADTTLGNTVEFDVVVGGTTTTGSPTAVPSVTTGAAVDVQNNGGTLKGTVNSRGGTTTAFFQYGTTTSYGQATLVQAVGNDTLDAEVSIPAANLLPGTRYFYRLVAENSRGTAVPDTGRFFDTAFAAPVVETGIAEALTTTSVSIPGTVRARNTNSTVDILFGTNPATLSSGATATPASVSGDTAVNVSAEIGNLLQSVTYFYQVRAVNSGGTTLGPLRSFRVTTLSGLLQIFPVDLPAGDHLAALQVNLSPPAAAGGWRLAGEQEWRLSGDTISGLATGDRVIEYRAVSGYIQPSSETVSIVSGSPASVLSRTYTASGATGSGSLTVNIKPDSFADPARPVATRAQWRLLGQTASDWKNSGTTISGLVPGSHVIESKPIAGRSTPPPASVVISNGSTTATTLTYFEADPAVGSLPGKLTFATVSDSVELPYAFVGQIRSNIGSATGFVVRPRVVATVAHSVFDDGTLAAVTGLQWLFQRHRNIHEPTPLIPRGFYTMTGYAAQRAIDNSPGISTPESQHLDAAAMYFAEDAGRAGFSGYLASDLDENEFLLSAKLKTLVGYPVENISPADRDQMHATTPANITFTRPPGQTRTFTTTAIRSTGGHSGGPLCVLSSNGKFYPAAIYLGGTAQTVVRAIDSDVATLFGFAEISANSASSIGSGSITASQSTPVGTPTLGSLKVIIEPAGARSAGAGWRIGSGSFLASGAQIDNLSPNFYGIDFPTVSGFEAPATPSVEIVAGQLNTVTFTYEIIIPPPVINSAALVTVNKNAALLYQTTATNSPDMFSLSGLLPLGTVFDPATGRITGFPQEAGKFPVVIGVSNSGGSDTLDLEIISLPLISPQTTTAPYLVALSYQILSSENGGGAVFAATNLPPGLVLDPTTGIVSGTPTTPGVYVSAVTVSRLGAEKTAAVTFTITGTSPGFTQQPVTNLTVNYGQSVTLSIAASGLPAPSVQWYRGVSGDISSPMAGAIASTFVSPPLTASTRFWARITNLTGTADSTDTAITVLPSANADLAFLTLSAAAISPSFTANTTAYTASVPNSVASVTLTPFAAVPVSTVRINGTLTPLEIPSSPIALSVGSNLITILVTAQNGVTTKTYTLTITRAPTPVVMTLGSDTINDISATVRGSVNPNGSGTVFFEYGPTTSYGSRTPLQQVSGTSALPISAALTGLQGNVEYHYRIALSDGGAPVFGSDRTFTTSAPRPVVVTGNAVAVSETGATLIGIVNPRGTSTNVHFQYGTSPALLGSTTAIQNIGSGTTVKEVTAPITGLTAGVTYFFRAVATSAAIATPVLGEIKQFTAQITTGLGDGLADGPPQIILGTEAATSVLADRAVLQATINPNDGSTLVFFEYGTTAAYGFQSDSFRIGNGTQNALVTIPIENLQTGVAYFFRTVAENAKGKVIGTGSSFSTSFGAPVVVTGEALPISTRSARVTGTVQANGTTRDVFFKYGTDGITFPLSVRAFQQTVSGNIATPVSVDLVNLAEGTTYFYKLVATNTGQADGTDGTTLPLNASILVGLIRKNPDDIPPGARSGQFTMNLLPSGTGNWRFRGEQAWRTSGETATSLASGDRYVEFRPVAGFIQPPSELISLVNGENPAPLERSYYVSAGAGTASLRVNLIPAAAVSGGAQWRLAGDIDTAWKNSADLLGNLPHGTYLIECKEIPGWDKPTFASASLTAGQTTTITITYNASPTGVSNPPSPVAFDPASGTPNFHVGQIRSDSGSFSGFAVKPRVVATVAQAVFNEATLTTITDLQWLLQRDRNAHEPKPLTPRGTYVFVGYDTQRIIENTPGVLATASQNLNTAALYFFEDAGRGGFSGYLGSNEAVNPFLTSSASKILAGYPVNGVTTANVGKLHATAPSTATSALVQGKTYQNTTIRGLSGMPGGPFSVQHTNGAYYPAGIYLGGTTNSLIRAIDGEVIDLFTRAEVSGNGGDNNVGGGITVTSIAGNLNVTQTGALQVIIQPSGATLLGAGWQLNPESGFRPSPSQRSGLTPGKYDLNFTSVPGFFVPTIQSVTVTGGQLTTITFTYAPGASAIDTWRYANFETYENTGDAADNADPDKDGETNADEFTADTDPNNGGDVLKITNPTKSGNTYTANVAGKAGRSYKLLRNTTLSGTWTTVDTRTTLTSDQGITLTDPAAPAGSAFYRIEVLFP